MTQASSVFSVKGRLKRSGLRHTSCRRARSAPLSSCALALARPVERPSESRRSSSNSQRAIGSGPSRRAGGALAPRQSRLADGRGQGGDPLRRRRDVRLRAAAARAGPAPALAILVAEELPALLQFVGGREGDPGPCEHLVDPLRVIAGERGVARDRFGPATGLVDDPGVVQQGERLRGHVRRVAATAGRQRLGRVEDVQERVEIVALDADVNAPTPALAPKRRGRTRVSSSWPVDREDRVADGLGLQATDREMREQEVGRDRDPWRPSRRRLLS